MDGQGGLLPTQVLPVHLSLSQPETVVCAPLITICPPALGKFLRPYQAWLGINNQHIMHNLSVAA